MQKVFDEFIHELEEHGCDCDDCCDCTHEGCHHDECDCDDHCHHDDKE